MGDYRYPSQGHQQHPPQEYGHMDQMHTDQMYQHHHPPQRQFNPMQQYPGSSSSYMPPQHQQHQMQQHQMTVQPHQMQQQYESQGDPMMGGYQQHQQHPQHQQIPQQHQQHQQQMQPPPIPQQHMQHQQQHQQHHQVQHQQQHHPQQMGGYGSHGQQMTSNYGGPTQNQQMSHGYGMAVPHPQRAQPIPQPSQQHIQQPKQTQSQFYYQTQMQPTVTSEPSVRAVKQQIQKPLTGAQQHLLQSTSQLPPGSNVAQFMSQLDDVSPTIPDAVTEFYMKKCGIESMDPKVTRLISLATQKYISDIIVDASLQAKAKQTGPAPKKGSKDTKMALTNDVLEPVLKEYGLNLVKAPYNH